MQLKQRLLLPLPWLPTSKKGLVIVMEKSVAEMRFAIVSHYEEKGYSHEQAEAYIRHDVDEVLRVYHNLQEEKKLPPKTERNNPLLLD